MNGLIWILIGVIAAVIAKKRQPRTRTLIVLAFGVIGAFAGGSLYGLLVRGMLIGGSGLLPIGSVIAAAIGASVLIWLYISGIR